jgi:hypothetical protein
MTTTLEAPPLGISASSPNFEEVVKQRTVLIAVTLRKLGVTRKVDSNTSHITTETDRRVLAINKVLLIAPELDKIKKLDGKIRTELRRMTLPDETLRRGWYLISKDMVSKIDTILEDYKAERESYVAEFKSNYWSRIKEAEPRLRGMFSHSDYPDIEELEAAFGMEIDYRDTIPKLDAIQDVADGIIHARQHQKAVRDCQKIVQEVEAGLIEMLQHFTGHLAARLGRQPDGKLMVFKDTSVAHFKEFVENLQAMNVTGNVTIEELGDKARQLLEGVNVEALRKNENFRDTMKTKLETLKKEIDGNVKPTGRKFAKVLRGVEDDE